MSTRLLARPRQAIGNRAPIWPFRLDRAEGLAKGIVGVWPIFAGLEGLYELEQTRRNYSLGDAGGSAPDLVPASGVNSPGGMCLYFDGGQTRRAKMANGTGFVPTLPFTFLIWANIADFGDYRTYWSKRVYASGNAYLQLYTDLGSGYVGVYNLDVSLQSNYVPPLGEWVRLAFVFDTSGSWDLYVNGVLDQSNIGTLSLPGSQADNPVNLGNTDDNDDPYAGYLGAHLFYNRALSAAEIWADYNPQTRWALYDELHVPRIWPAVATGGATTQTLTGSLDAAARKQILLAASLNAGVAAEFGGTASVDAALQAARAAQAALDTGLERALTADIAADGAIQAIRTLSISAESAVAKAIATAASLDARVTGAGVGLRGAALDAAVERLLALAASLNAAVARLHALQAGLDAGLAVPGVRVAALEGAIERLDTLAGLALEAAVRHSADLSAVLDAVVGTVVAPGATRTFQIPARGGHAVAGDLRTLMIPGGNRRH